MIGKLFFSGSRVTYYPLVVDSAKGCIVIDIDGNEYLDFYPVQLLQIQDTPILKSLML